MKIQILKSKIHRVKVTGADLNYIGSITIDEDLMDAANIIEGEKIQIVNNNNGERFDTYVIPGQRNSGEITVNGAAARKVQVDDVLILITYAFMSLKKAKSFGTKLYVGVLHDESVESYKRVPILELKDRTKILENVKIIDKVN